MRKVVISDFVIGKINILKDYLVFDLKLSEDAAIRRIDRIGEFLLSFGAPVDYPLCRFKKWRAFGYRCAIFEKDWGEMLMKYFTVVLLSEICRTFQFYMSKGANKRPA